MIVPAFWHQPWTAALVNHLWQSTAFAVGAWLLTIVLRQNHARTRFRLWMIASAKFLVPISLLIGVGERLQLRPAAQVAPPAFSMVMEGLTEPVPVHATIETARPGPSHAAPAPGEHWRSDARTCSHCFWWECGDADRCFCWCAGGTAGGSFARLCSKPRQWD
jgi:hypothetical protein